MEKIKAIKSRQLCQLVLFKAELPTSKEIAATMCHYHVDYPLPCSLCQEIALKEFADVVH